MNKRCYRCEAPIYSEDGFTVIKVEGEPQSFHHDCAAEYRKEVPP